MQDQLIDDWLDQHRAAQGAVLSDYADEEPAAAPGPEPRRQGQPAIPLFDPAADDGDDWDAEAGDCAAYIAQRIGCTLELAQGVVRKARETGFKAGGVVSSCRLLVCVGQQLSIVQRARDSGSGRACWSAAAVAALEVADCQFFWSVRS